MPEWAYQDYARAILKPVDEMDLADRIIIRIFQGETA